MKEKFCLNLIEINSRFHADGVSYNGLSYFITNIGFQQSEITKAILLEDNEPMFAESNFPEHQFTENEKCNLFFTISHFINYTALAGENENNTYVIPDFPQTSGKDTVVNTSQRKDFSTEIPIKPTMSIVEEIDRFIRSTNK